MLSPWCLQSKEGTVEDSGEGGNGGHGITDFGEMVVMVMAQMVVMAMGVVLVKV